MFFHIFFCLFISLYSVLPILLLMTSIQFLIVCFVFQEFVLFLDCLHFSKFLSYSFEYFPVLSSSLLNFPTTALLISVCFVILITDWSVSDTLS